MFLQLGAVRHSPTVDLELDMDEAGVLAPCGSPSGQPRSLGIPVGKAVWGPKPYPLGCLQAPGCCHPGFPLSQNVRRNPVLRPCLTRCVSHTPPRTAPWTSLLFLLQQLGVRVLFLPRGTSGFGDGCHISPSFPSPRE